MQIQNGKAKQEKTVEQASWLTRATGPVELDFVSELSLELCIAELEAKEEHGFRIHPSVYVEIGMIDADTYSLYIRRRGSKYTTNQARGILERRENTNTHVNVKVWVSPSRLWGLLLVVPVTCVFMLLMSATGARGGGEALLCLGIIFPLIGMWGLFDANFKRDELVRLIKDALGYVG